MIKRLRLKFIFAAMISSFLVLFVIMGIVNGLNYQKTVAQADSTLSLLAENDGEFPKKENMKPKPDSMPMDDPMLKELPYESRYFFFVINEGEVVFSDMGKIAAVDYDTAYSYTLKAIEGGKEKGFVESYRYAVNQTDSGTRVIFLDCTRSLSTFYNFLSASVGISAAGLLVVLILLILLSGKIIRPVSESFEKQKQFITDAGHEIKTPVTIIDADAEVLKMEIGDNEWLSDIQTQSKRLAALTNELIYLSRMEENDSQIQLIDFPISDVVNETAQSFQSLSKLQKKDFAVDIQPMISLKGDESSIRRLIVILLDNALKYSDENGKISVSLKKHGRVVKLTVSNTTNQQLPDNLNDLFGRFYRADKSRNSGTGGYGLGLSIAKAIVEANKGKIQISKSKDNILEIKVSFTAQ